MAGTVGLGPHPACWMVNQVEQLGRTAREPADPIQLVRMVNQVEQLREPLCPLNGFTVLVVIWGQSVVAQP